MCDQPSSEYQRYQIHHPLKEQVAAHKASHTFIIGILGTQKSLVAFSELLPFNLFICKGLYNTDPGQRILKTRINIPDLTPVVHECRLHLLILPVREEQHEHYQNQKRYCQSPVNQKQEYERTDNFDQRNK